MTERRFRPWLPVAVRADNERPLTSLEIRKADCVALQAVASGTASEEQQKRAIATVMHISGVADMAWLPEEHGGERDTAFAAGKQFVGHQIRKLVSHPLDVLTGERQEKRRKFAP